MSWRSEWLGSLKGGICWKEGREEMCEKGEREGIGEGGKRDKREIR